MPRVVRRLWSAGKAGRAWDRSSEHSGCSLDAWNGVRSAGTVGNVLVLLGSFLGPSECQEAQGSRGQLEAIGRKVGSGSRSGEVAEA